MIEPENQVSIRIGGARYEGWTRVSISAGIERACRDFALTLTLPAQGLRPEFARAIAVGEQVQVFIGSDLVLTGHIDALPKRYDARGVDFGAVGRSLTADLVDCSAIHDGSQWRGRTLAQIARDLAKPYGVTVIDQGVSGAPIPDHQIDPGESAFDSINRALQLRQVLAFDDERGRLILGRVGGAMAHTALVYGENLLEGSTGADFSQCYGEYRVYGQRAGDDDDFGAVTNQQRGRVLDPRVRRRRVLLIKQSGQADIASCRARAWFEREHRAAKPWETDYIVVGWRQGDGSLWRPNLRVRVWDEIMGYDGTEMVIAEVTYQLDDERGTTCALRVGPVAAYLPEPPENRRSAAGLDDDAEFSP